MLLKIKEYGWPVTLKPEETLLFVFKYGGFEKAYPYGSRKRQTNIPFNESGFLVPILQRFFVILAANLNMFSIKGVSTYFQQLMQVQLFEIEIR